MSESTDLQSWPEGITAARIPANNNVRLLQAIKINPAISATTAAQPGSPSEGDVYILPSTPTGAMWVTFNEGDVVIFYEATWTAYTPIDGLRKFVIDEGEDWQFIGGSTGAWSPAGGGGGGAVWGTITGTLSDQTDLDTALGLKADTSSLATIATTGALLDATDFPGGTSDFLRADGSFATPAGGGGSPGGSTTQVQYNNAGAFAGDADFVFDSTTNALSVPLVWTAKGSDIARAATTSIAAATGNFVHLTGTTTITSFGTGTAGQTIRIRFAGAGTLTHNATSLILPGAANITTAANDTCVAVSEGGSNWRVTDYMKASGVAVVVAGATITGWTASTNTASPNSIFNVARFLVASASTNADACIQPKGTGALLAQLPDGTTTGGDKRESYCVDWQMQRGASTQVASGIRSVIGGGSNNTASLDNSTVAGGTGNTASGAGSTVAGGDTNTASSTASTVSGGTNNVASGSESTVPGGSNNDADGQYSLAMGFRAQARGIIGAIARCSGGFNNFDGDGQDRQFYLAQNTSNATITTATVNRAAASTDNQIILPNDSAFVVKGTINVRQNTTGDSSAWDFTAYIKRGANAAATAMVAACTPVLIAQDAGAATWAVTVDADTTNGGLRCRVTGQASHDLAWGWSIYSCNEVVG